LALAGATVRAVHPGAHAAGAKRDRLIRLVRADCYGRVRLRRPGHTLSRNVFVLAFLWFRHS
jgi:hypothetical protein